MGDETRPIFCCFYLPHLFDLLRQQKVLQKPLNDTARALCSNNRYRSGGGGFDRSSWERKKKKIVAFLFIAYAYYNI